MRRRSISPVLLLLALVSFGCVSKSKFDLAMHDAQQAHAESDARGKKNAELEAKLSTLEGSLKQAEADAQARDQKLSELSTASANLQQKLDEATAINQQMRGELQRLGKDVDKILKEKGELSSALEDAKARLAELRRAQEAADKRAALFADLTKKLQKMIDAGSLTVVMRDGRMVLQLSNDVLFDSGQVKVKPSGRAAIGDLATALKTISDRKFQVAGHTDDVPVKVSGFASNWELSTARAVEVVELLIKDGVKPQALSAAGYGEFDPIAPNTTPIGRTKNRRIEITLVPDLSELVAVPSQKPATPKP